MTTVSAGFESQDAVRMAVDQLVSHGFLRADIRFEADEKFVHDPVPPLGDSGLLARVSNFLSALGSSAQLGPPALYRPLIERGGSVLLVDTATSVESATARMLMRRAGAVLFDDSQLIEKREQSLDETTKEDAPRSRADEAVTIGGLPLIHAGSGTLSSAAGANYVPPSTLKGNAVIADLSMFKAGAFEVRLGAEQLVVRKSAQVIEELVIRKRVDESTETVQGTVRQSVVEVERLPR